jgi:hypothetical protein
MANLNKSQSKAVKSNTYFARLTRVETQVRVEAKEFITPLTGGFVIYQRQAHDAKGNVALAWVRMGPRGKVWDSGFEVIKS